MMHNPDADNTKDIRFTYYNGDLQKEEYEEEDDTPDFPGFDRSKFKFNSMFVSTNAQRLDLQNLDS